MSKTKLFSLIIILHILLLLCFTRIHHPYKPSSIKIVEKRLSSSFQESLFASSSVPVDSSSLPEPTAAAALSLLEIPTNPSPMTPTLPPAKVSAPEPIKSKNTHPASKKQESSSSPTTTAAKTPPPTKNLPPSSTQSSPQSQNLTTALQQALAYCEHQATSFSFSLSNKNMKTISSLSAVSLEEFFIEAITLPERGVISLQFSTTKEGKIGQLKILSGSEINQKYVKQVLQTAIFPKELCSLQAVSITLKSQETR